MDSVNCLTSRFTGAVTSCRRNRTLSPRVSSQMCTAQSTQLLWSSNSNRTLLGDEARMRISLRSCVHVVKLVSAMCHSAHWIPVHTAFKAAAKLALCCEQLNLYGRLIHRKCPSYVHAVPHRTTPPLHQRQLKHKVGWQQRRPIQAECRPRCMSLYVGQHRSIQPDSGAASQAGRQPAGRL